MDEAEKRIKRLPIHLTDEEYEWLRDYAHEERRRMSQVILEALRAHYPDFGKPPEK